MVFTSATRVALDGWALVGFVVWAAVFGLEVVADSRKIRFYADPANKGKFISTGLWAESLLLIKVSGIPLPEKSRADVGRLGRVRNLQENTPVLVPAFR